MKLAILTCGIVMYICQDALFEKLSNIHRYKKLTKRILAPEENTLLFQNTIGFFNDKIV